MRGKLQKSRDPGASNMDSRFAGAILDKKIPAEWHKEKGPLSSTVGTRLRRIIRPPVFENTPDPG